MSDQLDLFVDSVVNTTYIFDNVVNQTHTPGHFNCPACNELRSMYLGKLSASLPFIEAAELYLRMRSVDAAPGAVTSARYVKPNTFKYYKQSISALNLFFGAMRLDSIHLGHFREYQLARLEGRHPFIRFRRPQDAKPSIRHGITIPAKGKIACAAKPKQINQELCVLKTILKRAGAFTAEMDEFAEDLQEDGNEIPRALSPEEQSRWLEISRSTERWNLIHWYSIVAFDTTCSTNELRALRLGDVSLQHEMINIPWPGSKNKYRHRSIAVVNADCLWSLERLIERARDLGANDPQHYLFPFRDPRLNAFDPTRPMTVSGLKKKWEEVRTASGLEWFRLYDTRHTGITRLAEQGIPPQVIMSRAGHVSPRMMQWYTHVSDSAQRRSLQRNNGPYLTPAAPQRRFSYDAPVAKNLHKAIMINGEQVMVPA